jgi:hypothetical protein
MSCSTIHLFLGILCIFNIILYKSINLESTSIVEKFDIVSLQSQINLVKTQIASMKTSIIEQNKVLKAAMDKYFEEQNQKNRDEYEFQKEQDELNQRLLSDMELNLSKLESQLKSEVQSQSQSQNIVFDLDLMKNTDNINLIIDEINKFLEEVKNNTEITIKNFKTKLNEAQNKYNLSKTAENKNELDAAIAGINITEYMISSINSYKHKFQSLLAIDKTDENIKKILAPTHYPIAKLDPNFKNNESVYNQQIIGLEDIIKEGDKSFSSINEYIKELNEILVTHQNSSDPNKQKQIDDTLLWLNQIKCLKEIMKIFYESSQKCMEYTKNIISLNINPQPARTSVPTVQPSRTTPTTTTSTPTTTTSTPTRNAPTGQNYYDIVYPVDDKLNPIYPPTSTETPNAYNSVSNRQMNNTQFVYNCNLGPNGKVVVDKLPLYYSDINEEDPEVCKSKLIKELQNLNINIPTPSPSPSDSVKELKYGNTKNGSSIINSMIMLTVFCVTMLITTLLLPYLIDNQYILSGIITVINIAIIITIFILTYYLFDNSIKSENNKINISNYKFNIMTIMGYLVALMGLIIFFICGVPNIYLLFNHEQSIQPTQYVQPAQPIQQL